jgi:hypothetical protein
MKKNVNENTNETGKEQLTIVLLKPVLETRSKLVAETQKFDKNFQF